MKCWKLLLILMLLSGACTLTQENFLVDLAGEYSLTESGVTFLTREFGSTVPVALGSQLIINGAGDINLVVSETENRVIFSLESFQEGDSLGVFRLEGQDKFFGMGFMDNRLIATTNQQVTSVDQVSFSFPVPIATRN